MRCLVFFLLSLNVFADDSQLIEVNSRQEFDLSFINTAASQISADTCVGYTIETTSKLSESDKQFIRNAYWSQGQAMCLTMKDSCKKCTPVFVNILKGKK